eukprot:jgi/Orpsp1_1/1186996/evm.model.d7180000054729.1
MQKQQYELSDPPSDGISTVKFSYSNPSLLLVSSWDKTVRLYDVTRNKMKLKYSHDASVLDCCFYNDDQGYSGGLDRKIKITDFNTGKESVLGSHEDAVKCLEKVNETNVVISGSWDKSIGLWDQRSNIPCVGKFSQPEKIYTLDVVNNILVVGMAARQIYIYDIRNLSEAMQKRESSLKFMTRVIKCMPNGEGYASSSIEGRVAVEFFDTSEESQRRKYAFKCHREIIDGVSHVYPVNALSFHPKFGTFASGGGDGNVYIWDGFNKKRLRKFTKYPTTISSLSFNSEGSLLAVASSYTFEEGEKDHPPDTIYIRSITDSEVKPKTKAK